MKREFDKAYKKLGSLAKPLNRAYSLEIIKKSWGDDEYRYHAYISSSSDDAMDYVHVYSVISLDDVVKRAEAMLKFLSKRISFFS